MTAMQITMGQMTMGARGQIRAGSGLRRLALLTWIGMAALGAGAYAQEGPAGGAGAAPGALSVPDATASGAIPETAADTAVATTVEAVDATVDELLSEFLPRLQNGTAPAPAAAELEADDGIVGLIEAPKGAPGVDADTAASEFDYPEDMGASGIASFAEAQPQAQARALMPGPVGHPPVVVELFTSQGCSSCPPADQMLRELANRDDVLALSWHVDYWDYLGWADDFARPEFTRRQQAYAHATGERAIYTPQIIVGGTDTLIALRPAELMALLQAQIARPTEVMVTSSQQDDGYRLELTPRAAIPSRVAIILVRYAPSRKVTIMGGENRGTLVEYRNVVLAVERIAEWDGRVPLRMTIRPGAGVEKGAPSFPPDTRHAILAQEMDSRSKRASGSILAAIRLD